MAQSKRSKFLSQLLGKKTGDKNLESVLSDLETVLDAAGVERKELKFRTKGALQKMRDTLKASVLKIDENVPDETIDEMLAMIIGGLAETVEDAEMQEDEDIEVTEDKMDDYEDKMDDIMDEMKSIKELLVERKDIQDDASEVVDALIAGIKQLNDTVKSQGDKLAKLEKKISLSPRASEAKTTITADELAATLSEKQAAANTEEWSGIKLRKQV